MAYIKFKELTKYFDFKDETDPFDLPYYAKEYVEKEEKLSEYIANCSMI